MNILRKSLLTQLVSAFSALSLVTISLVSYSAYTRARESLQTEVFARLNVAVSLKEFELNQWFESQRREAVFLARSPVVINAVSAMLPPIQKAPAEGEAGPNIAAQINALTAYFSDVLDIKTHIQGIDILRNGIVIFSTDASQIGIYKGLGNPTTYFEPNQANAIPNIYISPITQQPTITFATPILDQNTERKAVLAITLSLDAIDQLIRQRAGLGATGETYLVQRINNRSVFLSGNRSETTPTVPVPDASIPDPDISSPSTAASSPTAAGASTPNEVLPSTPDTPATSPPLADAADTFPNEVLPSTPDTLRPHRPWQTPPTP